MADNIEKPWVPGQMVEVETAEKSPYSDEQVAIAQKIHDAAVEAGVDPVYALSIAHIENGFNTGASPTGATGPMQLTKGTADYLGVDRDNIDENIKGGVTYLKEQLNKFKDPYVAGIAYNGGPGMADEFIKTGDSKVLSDEAYNYYYKLRDTYKLPEDVAQEEAPKKIEAPTTAEINASDKYKEAIDKTAAAGVAVPAAAYAGHRIKKSIEVANAADEAALSKAESKLSTKEGIVRGKESALAGKQEQLKGRILNQTSLAEEAQKNASSLRKAQLAAQERLVKATESARKLNALPDDTISQLSKDKDFIIQHGKLDESQTSGRARGTGYTEHTHYLKESADEQKRIISDLRNKGVVSKNSPVVKLGPTTATPSGILVKSEQATNVYNPAQQAAQNELRAAEVEHQRLSKIADKAENAAQGAKNKLRDITEKGPSGLTVAEQQLAHAKNEHALVKNAMPSTSKVVKYARAASKIPFTFIAPAAFGAMDAVEATNRFKRGEYGGAAISGLGALGGALSMVPPIGPAGAAARLGGLGLSLAVPVAQYAYDRYNAPAEPEAKYAAGGAVKKFSKGGLGKIAKQAATKLSEALGEHEAKIVAITQADRQKVGSGYLGGPGFSSLQHVDPAYGDVGAVWAVKGPGVAKTLINSAKRQPEGQTIFIPMLGSPTQHKSGQMVFDKIIKNFRTSARQGNLDPELLDIMNLRLINTVDNNGKPLFSQNFNIASHKSNNEINTFDKRAAVADVIAGIGVGGKKSQIIDYDKLIASTTDPDLIDAPTGSLGSRMFTLSGEMLERPDLHPAFPTILTGEDLNVHFKPAPREIVLNDFIKSFTEAKGREPGVMDLTRGYAPSNMITEEMLTNLQKAGYANGGLVQGYDDGGKVDLANSSKYIDGSSRENNPYGYVLDDSNSRMDVSPRAPLDSAVISDRGNLVHNMVSERDRLTDKYLGSTGRFASKGLEYLRTALDKAPSFTGKTLSSMGIDPNYVPIIGPIMATSRPTRQSDVVNGELKIGTDLLLGQLPETLYDYTTSGQPGFVRDGKWVHNPVTGGMMYTDPYGDINALDFVNLAGIEVPIAAGAKAAYKVARPLARSAAEHTVSGINRANRAMRTADPLLMNVETSTANRSDDVAETLRRFKEASGSSKDYPVGQGVWTGEEGAAQFHPNVMANIEDFSPEQVDHMRRMLDQYGIGAGRFRSDLISQPGHANAIQVLDADPEWIKNIGQHYAQSDLPAVVFAQPNNRAMVFNMNSDLPKDLSALLDAPQLKGKKVRYGEANIPTDRNYIDSAESARVTGTKKTPKKKAK